MLDALDMGARDALAKKHWPDGMAFDAAREDLLRRGWPFLRVLDDDPVENKKGAAIAKRHAGALDPKRFVRWPREAARSYVQLFAAGDAGHPRDPKGAVVAPGPVDENVLDRALGRMGWLGYDWLMRDALLLAEAFVGPRVAAERTLAAIERFEPQPSNDRPSLWGLVAVGCLENFVLRADDAAFRGEVARRLAAAATRLAASVMGARIRVTLEGTPAYRDLKGNFHYDIQFLSVDEAFFPEYLAHEYADWLYTPQLARMAGPALMPKKVITAARRQAAWKQEERCETFGIVRHPFVVEQFAGMVASKGAKGRALAWLTEHKEYARPTLERLIAEGHADAATLSAILGGTAAAATPKTARLLTSKQVEAVVKRAFATLAKDLAAARGTPAKEEAAIRLAVHAIVEARANAGEVLPEAHVGQFLMLDGWGGLEPPIGALSPTDEEIQRWGAMIDLACGD